MAEAVESIQTIAEKRLSITRETELLQSFVRINVKEFDISKEENEMEDELMNQLQLKKIEGKYFKILPYVCNVIEVFRETR